MEAACSLPNKISRLRTFQLSRVLNPNITPPAGQKKERKNMPFPVGAVMLKTNAINSQPRGTLYHPR
jgi:hypothetical protein